MKKTYLLLFALLPLLVAAQVDIYFNDFEGGNSFYGNTTGFWDKGIPLKTKITSAYSGTNSWITDLALPYNGVSQSELFTPPIPLFPFDSGTVSFWHFLDLDTASINRDICSVYMREYGATTWFPLGYIGYQGSVNWTNANANGIYGWNYDSTGWMFSSIPFNRHTPYTAFYGIDTVELKFVMDTKAGHTGDGWAIDDFKFSAFPVANDIGLVSIIKTSDSTTTGDSIPIEIVVKNYGLDTIYQCLIEAYIDNFQLFTISKFFLNGLAPDSTANFILSKKYLCPDSNYNLSIKVSIINDPVSNNDSLSISYFSKKANIDIKATYLKVEPSRNDTTCWTMPCFVTIGFKNNGKNIINSATFKYKLQNLNYTSKSWTGNLAPNDTSSFTFSTHYFNPFGNYQLTGNISIGGENYIANNELSRILFGIYPPMKGQSKYEWCPTGGGIAELESLQDLNIFPNPATSEINIDIDSFEKFSNKKAIIFNVFSQVIMEINIPNGSKNLRVKLNDFAKGIYFIQIQNNKQTIAKGKVVFI